MKFSIPDMTCGHCKEKIENAVLDADEAAELTFDLDARTLDLVTDLSEDDARELIQNRGFSPALIN